MQAVGKWIVIDEVKEQIKVTKGGLELAESHLDDIRYVKGIVVSPGLECAGIGAGDTILYDGRASHGIEVGGEYHKVIREHDIIMILEENGS